MTQPDKFKAAKRFSSDRFRAYSPRGLLIYFLASALIPAAIVGLLKGQVFSVLIDVGCFAAYFLAGVLLRKGLLVENRPSPLLAPSRFPLKLISAGLVAVITGLLVFSNLRQTPKLAMLYASGAFLGMYLSYGFDRTSNLPILTAPGFSNEEIRAILAAAYANISHIEAANLAISQADFRLKIARICEIAGLIIAELETDPRGIRRARKFLNLYLENVRQIIEGYAKTQRQTGSPTLESNFNQALQAIESAFLEQHQKLLEEDVFDLDVKIEVLKAQLKHEGIL